MVSELLKFLGENMMKKGLIVLSVYYLLDS